MDKRLLDKNWRLNHLYSIRNKKRELVKFTPNKVQVHFDTNKHNRNIILKSRQLGFTTFEAIDALDDVLFSRNFDALMVAHDLESATTIFDKKIYFAWQLIPPELQRLWKLELAQAKTLKFGFGDGTFSSIAVDTSGRSGTYARVHITEFAKLAKERPDKAEEIIAGTIPAVPTGGRVDIESTAQGSQGLFYDIFWEAWRRQGTPRQEEWKAHFYNWRWDEEIDEIEEVEKDLPLEFSDYQKEFKLDDWEITYYYRKWLSLSRDWDILRREYPTTPEEAFKSVIEGVFYANEISRARNEGRFKVVPYDRMLKVHTVWDLGVGKNLAVGFYQKTVGEVRMIDYLQGDGSDGIPEICLKISRKPYFYGKHFLPHDAGATSMGTGETIKKTVAKLLHSEPVVLPVVSFMDSLNMGKLMWDRLWVSVPVCDVWLYGDKNSPEGDVGIIEWRRKWNQKLGNYTDDEVHDSASHKGSVHRYAAQAENQMTNDDFKPYKQAPLLKTSEYEG